MQVTNCNLDVASDFKGTMVHGMWNASVQEFRGTASTTPAAAISTIRCKRAD